MLLTSVPQREIPASYRSSTKYSWKALRFAAICFVPRALGIYQFLLCQRFALLDYYTTNETINQVLIYFLSK
jgi:hypothetical protein